MFESRTPWPIVFLSQSQSRLRIGGDFQRKMGPVIRNTPKLSLIPVPYRPPMDRYRY